MKALVRLPLAVLAAAQLEIGIWGELAPQSFYRRFPGFGHHWVAPMGPYDEHLLRDYAAAELGFAVLLLCAAVWPERRLVLVAGASFFAGTLPHFIFHLTTTAMLSTADDVASLGSFAVELALAALAMVAVARPTTGAVYVTP